MRRTFVISLLCVGLTASVVCAQSQPKVTRGSSRGSATQAVSAAEQLALARRLSMQMMRTPPGPQKFDLAAQVLANLSPVRMAWPNDKNAVVQSGIMQADLITGFGGWAKAVDVLQEVLPAAIKTETEPEVEAKLGQAYEQTGKALEAEKHFLAAEQAMHRTHPNRVESEGILSMTGMFYTRQNKPVEAIQRFREAEALPGQDIVNKIRFQLSVAEQAIRLGNNAHVAEFARLDDLILEAQRTNLSANDATMVSHLKEHAQRLRDALHR